MVRRVVLLLLVLLVPASAASGAQRYFDEVASTVQRTPDVKYGKADALRMDLYRPAGDTTENRPAILWLHGGGFRTGSRADAAPYAEAFARRGYVSAAVGYRLRPKGPSNQELLAQFVLGEPPVVVDARHDAQAAIRYVRANALALGVDPDRIVVGGYSAGAIAALGAAFTPADPGTSGIVTPEIAGSQVAAAISVAGAWDPRRVQGPVPPVRMFHGTADLTVPIALGQATCSAVQGVGGSCAFTSWDGETHDDVANRRIDEVVPAVTEFLCGQVLGECPVVVPPPAAEPDLRSARLLGTDVGRGIGSVGR